MSKPEETSTASHEKVTAEGSVQVTVYMDDINCVLEASSCKQSNLPARISLFLCLRQKYLSFFTLVINEFKLTGG